MHSLLITRVLLAIAVLQLVNAETPGNCIRGQGALANVSAVYITGPYAYPEKQPEDADRRFKVLFAEYSIHCDLLTLLHDRSTNITKMSTVPLKEKFDGTDLLEGAVQLINYKDILSIVNGSFPDVNPKYTFHENVLYVDNGGQYAWYIDFDGKSDRNGVYSLPDEYEENIFRQFVINGTKHDRFTDRFINNTYTDPTQEHAEIRSVSNEIVLKRFKLSTEGCFKYVVEKIDQTTGYRSEACILEEKACNQEVVLFWNDCKKKN
uniref:Secreted protein n=1 Tax=Steinernema glaseri TaxID=37863 RepID=A0A1I8AH93_9BILA